jgi:hypothetical protein
MEGAMTYLSDPRAINVLIIILFIVAAIRWTCAGNVPQAGYWASAALLNVFVTMAAK